MSARQAPFVLAAYHYDIEKSDTMFGRTYDCQRHISSIHDVQQLCLSDGHSYETRREEDTKEDHRKRLSTESNTRDSERGMVFDHPFGRGIGRDRGIEEYAAADSAGFQHELSYDTTTYTPSSISNFRNTSSSSRNPPNDSLSSYSNTERLASPSRPHASNITQDLHSIGYWTKKKISQNHDASSQSQAEFYAQLPDLPEPDRIPSLEVKEALAAFDAQFFEFYDETSQSDATNPEDDLLLEI